MEWEFNLDGFSINRGEDELDRSEFASHPGEYRACCGCGYPLKSDAFSLALDRHNDIISNPDPVGKANVACHTLSILSRLLV